MIAIRRPSHSCYQRRSMHCGPHALYRYGPRRFDSMGGSPCRRQNRRADNGPAALSFNANVSEFDDCLFLSVDLPGVKVQDINITEKNSVLTVEATRKQKKVGNDESLVSKFRRDFALDKKSTDRDGISANLSEGVLMLTIPKKSAPAPMVVVPLPLEPPLETDDTFHFQLEIPGVKLDDLKVTVTGDELTIDARRTRAGRACNDIKRAFEINADHIDASSVRAFLSYGILTLTASKKEPVSASTRTIPVTESRASSHDNPEKKSEDATKPVAAAVPVDDDKTQEGVLVETVAAEEEEEEYEIPPINVATVAAEEEEEEEYEIPPINADAESAPKAEEVLASEDANDGQRGEENEKFDDDYELLV